MGFHRLRVLVAQVLVGYLESAREKLLAIA